MVPRRATADARAPRPGRRPHAERDADGVDGLRQRPAGLRRARRGRVVHRRRRAPVRGLQRERPGDVLRSCAPRDRSRRPGTGRSLDPVLAADRRVGHRRGGARAPLPVADALAVHVVRLAGEHRGDPPGASGDRPRRGSVVRGPLPRALRRGARRPRGRRTGTRAARPLERRDGPGPDHSVQRCRGTTHRARTRRRRDRAHRTGPHEQHPFPATRAGLARRAPRATRERGAVLAFDETHTHVVGEGGATASVGTRARRGHDRQGGGGRHPDGRVRRQRSARRADHTKASRPAGRSSGTRCRRRRPSRRSPRCWSPRPTSTRPRWADPRRRDRRGAARRGPALDASYRSVRAPASGTGPTRGREPTRTR